MHASRNLRSQDEKIFLIGSVLPVIVGCKLPSNRDVLRVLFFNIRNVDRNVSDCTKLVLREVSVFWDKARIPMQRSDNAIKKLEKLYNEWRAVQKNSQRQSNADKKREAEFTDQLDDLFDIAHANALNMIKIPEDREFLLNQRKKGRVGYMHGIDKDLTQIEMRAEQHRQEEELRKEKHSASLKRTFQTCDSQEAISSSSDTNSSSESDAEVIPRKKTRKDDLVLPELDRSESSSVPKTAKKLRGSKHIITPKIVAAFDKTKLSDRDAVHVLTSVVQGLDVDPTPLCISRTTIQRCRKKMRQEGALKLKENFKNCDFESAIIHWDGKLFPNSSGTEKYDRIAIVVTNGDTEKIIGVPILPDSTGKEQAQAVYEKLLEWNLVDKIKGCCCDTTSSNLGHIKGAATHLERLLERDLLWLPCRHHIDELSLKAAFEVKMPASTGPNIPLFRRFKAEWPKIDKGKFQSGLTDKVVRRHLENHRVEIINFAKEYLEQQQPRDDYEEFLRLTLVFLGEPLPENKSIRAPGAIHHARWMAKAIYTLKIFLFRSQFKLSSEEKTNIRDLCIFIVKLYVQKWFTTPLPTKAASQDLAYIKQLVEYKSIDSGISKAALSKILNHLWYLAPENCGLAFFDDSIPPCQKRKMVSALEVESALPEGTKKIKLVDISNIQKKEVYDFISKSTLNFFERFNFSTDFLKTDPKTWNENDDYKKYSKIVRKFKVVNDCAERGVKLIDEYEKILTKNESDRQAILQTVSEYRKCFKDVTKKTMSQKF